MDDTEIDNKIHEKVEPNMSVSPQASDTLQNKTEIKHGKTLMCNEALGDKTSEQKGNTITPERKDKCHISDQGPVKVACAQSNKCPLQDEVIESCIRKPESPPVTYYRSKEYPERFFRALNVQREKGRHCDVVINVQQKQLCAHSCVLAANSPFLDSQFDQTFDNSNLKNTYFLKFPTDNILIVETLLEYMYTSNLGVTMDIVGDLIEVSSSLGMSEIVGHCTEHLINNINTSNWLHIRLLATEKHIKEVICCVQTYISEHLIEIICTAEFLELRETDIVDTLKNCNNKRIRRLEALVFKAILKWVCYNFEERQKVYPELLKLLRPELLRARSISAVLNLAEFHNTDIGNNNITKEFIEKISALEEVKLEEFTEEITDKDDEPESVSDGNDKEYQPYVRSKRPRKVLVRSGITRRGRPFKDQQKEKSRGRGRPPKLSTKMAQKTSTSPSINPSRQDNEHTDNAEPQHKEENKCFNNWSLTTSDMDINIEIDETYSNAPEKLAASVSPGKKRDILRCLWEGCTYETLYQKRLENHKEWHTGLRQHVCEVCGDAFANQNHLVRHQKLHTGHGKKYDCQWCPYSTLRSDKLRDHIKNRHQDVSLKLGLYEKGDKGKPSVYLLDKHQKVEVSSEEETEHPDSFESGLKNQLEETTTEDQPEVSSEKSKQLAKYGIVPKKARKLDFTSMTRRSRTKKLIGKVDGIPAAPLLDAVITATVQTSPKKPRGRPPTVLTGEKFLCPKCPKEFITLNQMRHHLRGHGSDQPMLCEMCGFTTKHYCAMKLHMNVHTGDVLKCTWEGCDYQTARRPLMRDHMNRHQGIKNHVCSVCGKAFTARKHMHRHEKTHVEVKPISCCLCEFRTTRNDKLREHMRVHHPEKAVSLGYMTQVELQKKIEKKLTLEATKPFPCTHCAFRTTTEQKLSDHVKRKHHEIAISTGLMSSEDWSEIQSGIVSKEKKPSKRKKKEDSPAKYDTEPQNLGKKPKQIEQETETSRETKSATNYLEQSSDTVQSPCYPKEDLQSPRNSGEGQCHQSLTNHEVQPPTSHTQLQQSSQPILHQSTNPPPPPPIFAISQNHTINHQHHHLSTTGTTQLVTHHQPGNDLVPPYIASVMIEGLPVQIPPEMQAQIQSHWPYQ